MCLDDEMIVKILLLLVGLPVLFFGGIAFVAVKAFSDKKLK